jgi:hypothetical protein
MNRADDGARERVHDESSADVRALRARIPVEDRRNEIPGDSVAHLEEAFASTKGAGRASGCSA